MILVTGRMLCVTPKLHSSWCVTP